MCGEGLQGQDVGRVLQAVGVHDGATTIGERRIGGARAQLVKDEIAAHASTQRGPAVLTRRSR